MIKNEKASELNVDAGIVAGNGIESGMQRSTKYVIECVRDGKVLWTEEFHNLVTTEGLNDSLDKHFKGSAYTASWFVGLTDGTPSFAAGDTLASHVGWVEVTAYTGNRQTLTLGTVSAGSVDNSASKASYTMTGSATVGGAFVSSVDTGTAGILYGGGSFSQDRALILDDVLNVTVTLTAASA